MPKPIAVTHPVRQSIQKEEPVISKVADQTSDAISSGALFQSIQPGYDPESISRLRPADVLQLQRTVGNRAVSTALGKQAKQNTRADEEETWQVAQPAPAMPHSSGQAAAKPDVQRQSGGEEDQLQASLIQRKVEGSIKTMSPSDLLKALKASYVKVGGSITLMAVYSIYSSGVTYTSVDEVANAMGLTRKAEVDVEKHVEEMVTVVSPPAPKKIAPPIPTSPKPLTKVKEVKPVSVPVVIPRPKLTRLPSAPIQKPKSLPKVEKIPPAPSPTRLLSSPEVSTSSEKSPVDLIKLDRLVSKAYLETSGRPQKTDFISTLLGDEGYTRDELKSLVVMPEFIWGFQAAVHKQVEKDKVKNKAFLEKTEIEELEEEETIDSSYRMADISKWTLRHYSSKGDDTHEPPFKEIRSALSIASETLDLTAEKKSGHTGDVDWNKFGNVGHTFYLLYLEGEAVQKQKFLANCKWYAEFKFDQPELWISSDWLDEAHIKTLSLRGSGRQVQKKLLKLIGSKFGGAIFRREMAARFNNLEVKVPGTLKVSAWQKA